jgi:hypothetical protein
MDDTTNLTDFNVLVMMPNTEYERLAKMRERQRRERKEELYSYCTKKTQRL